MEIKKILLYGQGNARDNVNHYELSKTQDIQICSLIKNKNAIMEKYKNVKVIKDLSEAIEFAKSYKPDLVIISNRADLSNGATEKFEENGFKVFGITRDVAKFETNKEFSKEFMIRNNILTPQYYVSQCEEEAIKYVERNWENTKYGLVLKVDQFSKNSYERTAVPETLDEAKECIYRMYNTIPNARIIIEEKIIGYELSLHVIINKNKYSIMPMVQDYKKKYPNNEGPMTAGTASVADSREYPVDLIKKIEKDIIEKTIKGFEKENITYNYILYIGLMITPDGIPYVLEYNTRTGNPEWLALLGLLKKPLYEVIKLYYEDVEKISTLWEENKVSIAMCGFSSGYPETERKKFFEPIFDLDKIQKDTVILGEHIVNKDNYLYPSGGRVFALRRTGIDFETIKKELIKDFYTIKMNGLYFRSDIKPIKLD